VTAWICIPGAENGKHNLNTTDSNMADTPQSFRSVEPLQQVEQPVSLNQRVDRNKDQPDRKNRQRRPKNPSASVSEIRTDDMQESGIQNPDSSEVAGDHIDFRA
jgi:hypothetical protein